MMKQALCPLISITLFTTYYKEYDVSPGCNEPQVNVAGTALVWGPCNPLDDQVSGFTNRQMFSCLTSVVTTVDQFRQSLITNHLAAIGNTQAQVNTLFNQY